MSTATKTETKVGAIALKDDVLEYSIDATKRNSESLSNIATRTDTATQKDTDGTPKNEQSNGKTVFFPALTSIRVFASFSVVIRHIELTKVRCGLPQTFLNEQITFVSLLGLNLFFIISGFLITYLLLKEAAKTGKIDIMSFYWRRALRLCPAFLVVIALSFFVIPLAPSLFLHPNEAAIVEKNFKYYGDQIWLYLCMLPNLAKVMYPRVIGARETWAVGVESQFYLFCPLLIAALWRKPIIMCLTFVLGVAAILGGLDWLSTSACIPAKSDLALKGAPDDIFPAFVHCMEHLMLISRFIVVGAVAAVIAFHKMDLVQRYLHNTPARVLTLVAVALYLSLHLPNEQMVCGILWGIAILSLTDPNLKLLNQPLLVKFGSISYGVYLYHIFIIEIILKLTYELPVEVVNLALYALVFPLAIGVAHLSYRYIEKPFLNLKRRFTVVRSG